MNNIEIVVPNNIEDMYVIRKLIERLSDESENFPFTSDDMNMSDMALKTFLEFLIASPNSVLALAYADKNIIGIGFLEGGKKSRTYHLSNLGIGVLAEYHNQGVGNALMDAMISYSRESEYIGKIDILVRCDNKVAIELYKKKGFVLEGKNRRSLFIDGIFYDMFYMGLIID